jgi:hypothetical protein
MELRVAEMTAKERGYSLSMGEDHNLINSCPMRYISGMRVYIQACSRCSTITSRSEKDMPSLKKESLVSMHMRLPTLQGGV